MTLFTYSFLDSRSIFNSSKEGWLQVFFNKLKSKVTINSVNIVIPLQEKKKGEVCVSDSTTWMLLELIWGGQVIT